MEGKGSRMKGEGREAEWMKGRTVREEGGAGWDSLKGRKPARKNGWKRK